MVTHRQNIHIILNPIAGRRRRGLLDQVVFHLEAAGASVSVEETTGPGHAVDLAARAAAAGTADVVAAAGGDGTINEVARGLLGSSVPLGVIPLGTANVLAIELGLGLNARKVADTLLRGPADLIGTGLVDGRIFLLMTGVGFDGEIVRTINPRLKRLTGKGAFVAAGLKAWFKGPGRRIRLTLDGREREAAWVLITNIRHYAGRFVLAPQATILEPGLTAFLFKGQSRWAFVKYLTALGLGRVGRLGDVEVVAMRRAEFHAPEGLGVEVDGDAGGRLPVTVEQGVKFLRLVLPER